MPRNVSLRPGRALAELTLIVLAVLIALAVDSWRQKQEERGIEREYLTRLAADLEVNKKLFFGYRQFHEDVLANAKAIYPIVKGTITEVGDTTDVIVHAYQATRHVIPDYVDDTFEELKSAGNLRLIENQQIRMGLLAYYRILESEDYPFELASKDYREFIRRMIDPELQQRIRAECELQPPHLGIGGSFEVSVAAHSGGCPVDFGEFDYAALFRQIANNDELRGALALTIMQWTRGISEVLDPALEHTEELRLLVVQELGQTVDTLGQG